MAASAAGAAPRRPRGRCTQIPDHLFERQKSSGRLGPFLAWSVVFADIGTSIYYVPGLLFRELGGHSPSAAAAFVLLTGIAFVLLALKYVDVAARYPDGGGVVSVASDAFGPMIGCIGGILICVDYFLTGAISSVSGFQYLAAELPQLMPYIAPAACGALIVLGLLNYIGIRESAVLTAVLAVGSLAVNLVVLVVVGARLDAAKWRLVMDQFSAIKALPPWRILVGFGSSWLAFSGLESISQIAPALQEPRERTALRAMLMVIAGILLTSPLITAFETALLDAARANPDQFLYELGAAYGTRALTIAIVLTSSTLLVGAANTALIGCYHVFLALVRLGYMPRWLAERNLRYGTPHRAIIIAVTVPAVVVLVTRGQMALLGDMYSFGLLGAFTLTSVGLDRMRVQENKRGLGFWLGMLTSLLVVLAWGVNLISKTKATMFGGGTTLLGLRGRLRRAEGLDRRAPRGVHRGRGGGEGRRRPRVGGRRGDAGRGDGHAGDVSVDDAGRPARAEPAPVPGGAGALARRGRRRGVRDLRRRDPGSVLPAQERPVERGAHGADRGGRLLQAGRRGRHPDLAHGPRRRRVGRRRRAQARRQGGDGGDVAEERGLAPAARERAQVAGQGFAAQHARLDL